MERHRHLRSIFVWLLRFLLLAVMVGMASWGGMAIYFGDSRADSSHPMLSILFAAVAFGAIIGQFWPRVRRRARLLFVAMFAVVLAWWLTISPSNQREWETDFSRLPYAEIRGDRVTIHNIRNFSYRTDTDYTPAWYTKTFDLNKLDSVDLYASYWMGPAIAHMIMSFGFGGKDFVAVSIEARKERGEEYSAIKSFFRQYELSYVVGDERDLIRLRTNYRNPPHEVHLFRLKVSQGLARQFCMDYFNAINTLEREPQFYNALMANCSNLVWRHGSANPQRVPFSWKVLLSGYGPEYLYSQGRIDTELPFDDLMKRSRINDIAQAAGAAPDFSQRIRAVLENSQEAP